VEAELKDQKPFQSRVSDWLSECFGPKWRADPDERMHRFVEEAIELAQAAGCTREEFHLLIDYVYGRPAGDLTKEVGGVMVTLAGLCESANIDLAQAADDELRSNYARIDTIRKKRQNRRRQSPLPG
jgi:NTP pyrophosphatase (non-canonical NTP hydrolase)